LSIAETDVSSFYLFQRGDSEYFAISDRKNVKTLLPTDVGQGQWIYKTRIGQEDLSPIQFAQTVALVAKQGFYILRLPIK
jgi:hypothetical protein